MHNTKVVKLLTETETCFHFQDDFYYCNFSLTDLLNDSKWFKNKIQM